ncbi:CRISPR-associated helicase Cas3' [Hominenteromicrobium sp.]|uniref:CRISPR-associated helicase Cas3' n=1 Tax=Hominenteromicrobium sp. TaxID=3073581 RepID=UPI003AB2A20B
MAFALTAAVQNCMSRVIYAAPYTSIIDQNADTFEKIFGTENVIEHHSSAEYLFSESPNPAEYRKMLAAENWDAPVIATTTVQLFESLFASKPARCRKLHNLANSVLILDEVQTLPMPYLKPFTAALAELARKYGVIVVLCTATQPALDGVFADLKIDLPIKEICPNVPENFETFRRTKIAQHTFDSTESLTAELTALPQVLCIVNRIADAQKIYQALPKDGAYCLTTHLCPAHRKARIKEIRERLKIGLPCRVVSTSLIEAGVDVDFPRVYREEAGLDSVLQAAGRCNREGKRPLDESLVTVFTVQNTTPPPYMRQPAAAMKNISKRMEDITSLAAIRAYFEFYRDLYGKEDLDREKILIAFENEMLPFASVAEKVRVIENCTTPVYIPIDQGEALVERLYRGERSRTLFRKLGQYSVNVYPQQLAALREAGAVQSIDGGALYVLADPRRYDSALGLTLDQTETALFI